MNATEVQDLWLRRLADESLSEEEDSELAATLIGEPEWRRAMLDDLSVHSMLATAARIGRGDDAFVAGVLTRFDAAELASPPIAGLVSPPPIQRPAAPPVLVSDEFTTALGDLPLDFSAAHSLVPARQSASDRLQRAVAVMTAIACSLLVIAGIAWSVRRAELATNAPSKQQRPIAQPTRQQPREASSQVTTQIDPPASEPVFPVVEKTPAQPREERVVEPQELIANSTPLVEVDAPVWNSGGPVNNVLNVGLHDLAKGVAHIDSGNGRRLELVAPARLQVRENDLLELSHGTLRAADSIPSDALAVATPSSELRDLQGAMEVTVDDAGDTEVKVNQGAVKLSKKNPAADARPLTLSAEGFDRAKILAQVGDSKQAPLASEITGPDKRFLGQIEFDGKTVEFGSAPDFDAFRKQVMERFNSSPDGLAREWKTMSKSVESKSDGSKTSIQVGVGTSGGGKASGSGSGSGFMQWGPKGQILNGPAQSGQKSSENSKSDFKQQGGSFFGGVININGKETRFTSPEEFEAAQKKMNAPADTEEQTKPKKSSRSRQKRERKMPRGVEKP